MDAGLLPDLQFSVVCDDVRQERNGKFILIGLFDVISGPRLPIRFPRICVVNRWCNGDGVFKQLTRIVRPDQSTVVAGGREIPIRLGNMESTATNIEFFGNLTLPEAGAYWVEIMLEGELRLRYPLRVVLAPAPPPPMPMPPPPGA